jgi:malonyl-CoA O-methyltransferase
VDHAPSAILDIGCGTGQLLSALRELYPDSGLYGLDLAHNMTVSAAQRLGSSAQFVTADAESIPFRDGLFDLLVSTSTLQWLDRFDLFFQQARRVMQVNGLLCVAFFGGRTLCELRDCFRTVVEQHTGGCSDYAERLHRFVERNDVEQVLERIDFDQVVFLSEIETDYYSNVHELLRSIKRIGAGASAQSGGRGGLGWRGVLNETSRLYAECYGTEGRIPATYEVMYVIARRGYTV